MKLKRPQRNRKRGSILLLVVITMSLLSMFAVASAENGETMLQVSSANREQLRARLAVDSALSHTRRQLVRNVDWAGTGGWLDMAGARFQVERTTPPGSMNPSFVLSSESGDAQTSLQADFGIVIIDQPFIDHAVAFLGGSVDFNNVKIDGDLLVVDTEEGVYDYDPISGEWMLRTSGGDPEILSNNNSVDGDLQTTTGNGLTQTTVSGEEGFAGPIANPRWDLDPYLTPNPDVIVVTDARSIIGLKTTKTVVVVNEPGVNVVFRNCDIEGGVVMWAPNDWPQRGPSRNDISWSNSTFGSAGGGTGPQKHVGIIAPAARLKSGHATTPGHGLFYFHEIVQLNTATIHGALWVTNEVGQWNDVEVIYDKDISSAQFMGMEAKLKVAILGQVAEHHVVDPYEI